MNFFELLIMLATSLLMSSKFVIPTPVLMVDKHMKASYNTISKSSTALADLTKKVWM